MGGAVKPTLLIVYNLGCCSRGNIVVLAQELLSRGYDPLIVSVSGDAEPFRVLSLSNLEAPQIEEIRGLLVLHAGAGETQLA